MALDALHLLMLGPQAEIGLGVVKLGLIKFGNQGGAALVVGMADSAGLGLHLPVKACLASHIDTHIPMAFHAQAILSLTIKL